MTKKITKKITALTPEQESKIPEWVKKWIAIGLSTEPADFETATDAALRAYDLCGLDRPKIVLRVGSPYEAAIVGAASWLILRYFSMDHVGTQVWSQVGAQVWDQVETQVRDQVGTQVRSQVWDQVEDQVRAQVWDHVGAQVRAQVWSQVGDHVESQVESQVRDQVEDQVETQVWDHVGAQVRAQVRAQVWSQVGTQVRAQVRSQVWSQVGAQVWDQVEDQVRDQVETQVRAQVEDQVRAQVESQVWDAAKNGFVNEGLSSLWCSFTAFASYFRDICGWGDENILEKLEINESIVKSCGYTWWHQDVLVISDRPAVIGRDAEGRLHCENGPSIAYRDGWQLCHWHGVAIPVEWMTGAPPDAKTAITWENIEQRRAACEIVGWKNILTELDAVVIDEDVDPEIGTLLEAEIPDSGKERFLKVRCGTLRAFVLPVPREMKTAMQASAWTYGLENDMKNYLPEIRT